MPLDKINEIRPSRRVQLFVKTILEWHPEFEGYRVAAVTKEQNILLDYIVRGLGKTMFADIREEIMNILIDMLLKIENKEIKAQYYLYLEFYAYYKLYDQLL